MLAWSFLLGMVQILDFLKFHHMFGPWAIIISSLLVDLGKFMTVLCLFLIGFSMLITAMNTPFFDENMKDLVRSWICRVRKLSTKIVQEDATQTNSLCPQTKQATVGKKKTDKPFICN